MRMRLSFFSFVLHLLFSRCVSLSSFSLSLSLFSCVVNQLLTPLSRESQTTATATSDDDIYRPCERGIKKSARMNITFLTKVISTRRDTDFLNVVAHCLVKSAMVIGTVAEGNIVADALIVN